MILQYFKEGKRIFFWTPAWIFNKELLVKEGYPYRNKYIASSLLLIVVGLPWYLSL